MKIEINSLPEDKKSLKGLILSLHQELQKQEEEYEQQKQEYTTELGILKEQIKLLRAQLFGRKSEKYVPEAFGQTRLFNENENEGIIKEGSEEKIIHVSGHTRKQGGKKPLPKDLPRVEIIHDLPEDEKKHGCGRKMKLIREEVTERLRHIPQKFVVEVNKRLIYGCPCEGVDTEGQEGAIRIAPMPEQMIPQGIATPSLLAAIMTSKFCDALPFYRQEKIYKRHGIDIPRQTMCQWAQKVYDKALPLFKIMRNDILKSPVINMDETPVQVMNEPGRANTTKSFMWVSKGEKENNPVLLYNYSPTRSTDFVRDFLKGYKGILQSDGYEAYEIVSKEYGIMHVLCWSHGRRRFADVVKTSKNKNSAHQAISYIQKLYQVEAEAKNNNLTYKEIRQLRQEKSKPVLDEFKKWLDKRVSQVPPEGLMGKAINYLLKNWDKFILYLEDGRIPIDNNLVENAIRPFVQGRKNWLFSGSPDGAEASAGIYGLIETAKANGLEPYWYLYYLFDHLPKAKTTEEFKKLLPYNVDKKLIQEYIIPVREGPG